MNEMIEALQNVVAAEPEPEVMPVSNQPEAHQPEAEPAREDSDGATETQLTAEISELWSQHTQLSGTRRMTVKELRLLRAKLAERLYAMKQLLCRVGRGGQWRGYLRAQHIPRTTADRLCERYAETLPIEAENVPTGAITENQDTVEQLVQTLLPRLKRTLPDTQAVFKFIAAVGEAFGLKSETTDDCIMLSQPKKQSELSASATGAPEAVSPDATVLGTENSSEGVAVQATTAETNGGNE